MKRATILRLIVGGGFLVAGIGLVLLWGAFAALYVPGCSSFSIQAEDPHCRTPVLWIYAGYLVAVAGAFTVGYEALRRLRRSIPKNSPVAKH